MWDDMPFYIRLYRLHIRGTTKSPRWKSKHDWVITWNKRGDKEPDVERGELLVGWPSLQRPLFKNIRKFLSDCPEQDSLVWWNPHWTAWFHFFIVKSGGRHRSPSAQYQQSQQWSTEEAASCCGAVFQQEAQKDWSWWRESTKYRNTLNRNLI